MSMYLKHIVPNFILMASVIICWHKLLDKKINFKNIKLYITLIGIMFISILNYIISETFLRVTIITIIFMFFVRFLLKENIQKCVITPIFHQFFVFFSETIYAIIATLIIGEKLNSLLLSVEGLILTNSVISIISVLLLSNKYVKKLYKSLINITEKIKNIQLIPLSCFILFILNIFNVAVYYKVKFEHLLLINVVLIVVFAVIIIYTLKTQNNYNKVSDKYNIATKSLNDYERMMTKYRITNHENKNLLLTIRAMILNKEKDIPKYIDSIIEEKFEDDEKLLFNMSVIPSGGLRATIYSEIMKIRENNINYSLNIDKKIRSIDLIELDTDTIIDICKIIGVFIDNAIDEVKRLKNKNIELSIFLDDKKLNIKVSNNYKGNIEIDKISNDGYTTKGKGHGYGLSLVKNIVNKNDLFDNKQEISKNIFSQVLSIKYKKSH